MDDFIKIMDWKHDRDYDFWILILNMFTPEMTTWTVLSIMKRLNNTLTSQWPQPDCAMQVIPVEMIRRCCSEFEYVELTFVGNFIRV